MSFDLTPSQLRVLGALLEKQITTPDQYPLTLKSLVSACNQKSNREPVMSLSEAVVQDTVAELDALYLVSQRAEYGSRVTKHRQRFCNTEFGTLNFEPGELAVVVLLMLRGPQTPGELRSRSGRLHAFESVNEVVDALSSLGSREDGPFVVMLEREPGRRENRYAHCLGDAAPVPATTESTGAPVRVPSAPERVESTTTRLDTLEARVHQLEVTLARLREAVR
ncbi:MAG: DUF480 domain-containing protein [Pseudomonadota bacterium]